MFDVLMFASWHVVVVVVVVGWLVAVVDFRTGRGEGEFIFCSFLSPGGRC